MINFIDSKIYNFIAQFINMPVTNVMSFISFLGSAGVLIGIVCILALTLKNKKIELIIAINLATVFIVNRILKSIVRRQRPEVLKLAIEDGYSFPSGHAMVAIGFYGLFIYLLYKNIQGKKKRRICIALLSLLIFLIGISRIYLGVHYATDIIGAYTIGLVYLILFVKFICPKFIKEGNKEDGDIHIEEHNNISDMHKSN